MKIYIDTKEDSHEEIRKAIKMLQSIVGEQQEILTNQPNISDAINSGTSGSAFANIFGDVPAQTAPNIQKTGDESKAESSESTEDLFAELFSEEEIKNMDKSKIKEDEEEASPKNKRYNLEFY